MSSAPRSQVVVAPVQSVEAATIRFCGDSGDGMQLAGAQFARVCARMGNSVCSSSDFPSEIRAPVGTLAGVSGYQVHFSSIVPAMPGERLDVLIAMNPAALQTNIKDLTPGRVLIVNADAFIPAELAKAGYDSDPLDNEALAAYRVFPVDIDTLTREAVAKISLTLRESDRCKNFFALGIACWLFDRVTEPISSWVKARFAGNVGAMEGNLRALKAGYKHCEQAEWPLRFSVGPAKLPVGRYRHLRGSDALILGLHTAARLAGRSLVHAATALTPASEVPQRLIEFPEPDAIAIQAEDDGAAASIALGASFAGSIGAASTSGPGFGQMSDALGLAAMAELPLVVIDVQRAGPCVGMPTKTEQSDLLQALFGRNGECPLPVLAPTSPSDGFAISLEAARLACKFMTPVVVLTDVFQTNGTEPWRLPESHELPIFADAVTDPMKPIQPYQRDEWLARHWIAPGTAGGEHRIGGLENENGSVSFEPLTHEAMVRLRAEKIARIADDIPELEIDGPAEGDLLVIGWGSTHGAIATAVQRLQKRGVRIGHVHLRYLNPLPRGMGAILGGFRRVLVPELNSGQLLLLLRSQFDVDIQGLHKLQGRPFLASEIESAIEKLI